MQLHGLPRDTFIGTTILRQNAWSFFKQYRNTVLIVKLVQEVVVGFPVPLLPSPPNSAVQLVSYSCLAKQSEAHLDGQKCPLCQGADNWIVGVRNAASALKLEREEKLVLCVTRFSACSRALVKRQAFIPSEHKGQCPEFLDVLQCVPKCRAQCSIIFVVFTLSENAWPFIPSQEHSVPAKIWSLCKFTHRKELNW